MTRGRRLIAAGVTALGCSRTPAPAGSGPARPAPVASSVTAGAAASSASAGLSAPLPDGCWAGFGTDVPADRAPAERLAALAERCAQGMKAFERMPLLADLRAGQSNQHDFDVAPGSGCVRLLAAGSAGVTDLDLDLVDAQQTSRARDQLRAPFALAPTPGPICLEPGKYRAVVSVSSGNGAVALSAYAAE